MPTREGKSVTLTAPRPHRSPLGAPRVVFSYRHEDSAAWAAQMGALLHVDLGIESVCLDRGPTPPGEVSPLELGAGVQGSGVTVVVVGHHIGGTGNDLRADAEWVRREIHQALDAQREVVAVVFGNAGLPDDVALLDGLHRVDLDRDDGESSYQSVLTAVWSRLEQRPDRMLLVADAHDGVDQAIADFISTSNEIDWAEPHTEPSPATRGLQVVAVERYADQWPDVVALDRGVGSGTLEARIGGLAHPEEVVRIRLRRSVA